MPAGSTYSTIATTTLGSNSGTVTFSSIPQIYTDLVLVSNYRTVGTPTFFGCSWKANGDTGSNYSSTIIYGNGTTTGSVRSTLYASFAFESYSSTNNQVAITNFMNYSNTSTFKTSISKSGGPGSSEATGSQVGLWRSTAAITSLTLYSTDVGAIPFAAGNVFTLYGIASA
jgi:hypothetical protein